MLLHGTVVVGTFLAMTYRPGGDAPQSADRAPVFLAPEPKPVSRGTQERLQYVGLAAGSVPVEATEAAFDGDAGTRVTVPGTDSVVVAADEEEAYEEFVLSEIDVDSAVVPDPESGGPEYPASLLEQNVEGVVLARFIVDSTGRVQAGSFLALEATNPLFTQAVRDALPRMKFRPAFVGQKRVPQLVVQSFAFRIAKPAVDTMGTRPVGPPR
jgi:protein TonB